MRMRSSGAPSRTPISTTIDAGYSGYVRHRFVKSLGASVIVAWAFCFVALGVLEVTFAVNHQDLGAAARALLALVFAVGTVLWFTVWGIAFDVIHRRLAALVLLVLSASYFVRLAIVTLLSVELLVGARDITGVSLATSGFQPDQAVGIIASGIFGMLICYEVVRHSLWQLFASADAFRAVRGWRAPYWPLDVPILRYTGLPSFISFLGQRRAKAVGLYSLVALMNLGFLAILLLPYLSGLGLYFEGGLASVASTVNWIIATLLTLNAIGAGNLVARAADAQAVALYQKVREWDTRDPIVFLRSFQQDALKIAVRGGDAFVKLSAGVGRTRTLDEILLDHGSPYGPVIAVGDPLEPLPPLGAARVFVKGSADDWQGVVRDLVEASKAIVICPGQSDGVRWEIDLVTRLGLQHRTILLANPQLAADETLALFQRMLPELAAPKAGERLIATFVIDGQARVLTAHHALGVDTYVIALNTALQAMFGMGGVRLAARVQRARRE